ncbi:membrane protein [Streptomyces griseoflavus]|uniref:hypothetical protein n=1 Tax=Streptomyces rimosus TaxID=1927 RepID=UPI0004C63218|nr:hypothetical protein [Streptomyces rimosus]KOG65780.1 membrane protein [Streptomyces griseoflavus]
MRSLLCAAGAAGILLFAAAGPVAADDGGDGFTITDPRIKESSGLAASRTHPGVYWTHNDSDDGPYVYAVDGRTGRTVATVTLRGIGDPRDVEAISVGPDGNVYVGDIGDNLGGTWNHVWIYRFPEPRQLRDQTVTAAQLTVEYDEGPRDAEAMMVHPKTGRVYIASKKKSGGAALYEGPERLSSRGTNTFRRIAAIDQWVTDGAFSPDGTRLVLRGYFGAEMYRWQGGRPKDIGSVGVPLQMQGESVSFTPDGRTLMFGSEGKSSRVQPVGLSGDQLPESAAKNSDGKTGGKGGTDDQNQDGPGKNRNVLLAAVTFGVGAVVVLGLRRVFRRK